ncbi:MAG TPA: substrate-binding domain-containing protein [Chthoniobacteraceae bacterium]|nr:substrate-binding domain-containing protein [Chthoniobacteraceae bacterium]
MKLRVTLVLVSCILSILTGFVLSRQSGPQSTTSKKRSRPLIGLSMDTLKEARWQGDRDMFVKQANDLGADVEVLEANSDDTRQIKDVEALITKGVDALVIIPHDGAACAKAVELSRQAGIPVLAYDRLITNSDLDLYMTFDNVKVGELQAKFVADEFAKTSGKKRLVRIYGSKTDNNASLFKQGQDNIISPLVEKGEIEVVHEDWAQDWRPENAKKIANAAITKAAAAPGALPFDAILASNDGTAGGAIQALLEEGLAGKIIVTGQDADEAACQRIVAGTQTMTIYKPLKELASKAAEAAVRLAQRRPVIAKAELDNGKVKVPSIFLEVVSVTKDNLKDTVIKDGFLKEDRVFSAQ